ncbi:MAG: hypothetical protein IIY21_04295 [Clostridiales bacterium]|nr:hypothetical protein [Clostridiales bacterium]MBQ1573894.1 hypothetical protein [Clostridiales bacterium]
MGEQTYIQKWVIVAIIVLFLMPVMISMFFPKEMGEEDFLNTYASENTLNDLSSSYFAFTEGQGSNTEMPWTLTGIYTPYTGGSYNYTSDGWLYGSLITNYSPSQYNISSEYQEQHPEYPTVTYDSRYRVLYQKEKDGSNVYRYGLTEQTYSGQVISSLELPNNTTQDGKKDKDLYTYVTMDVTQQSDIFFTSSLKHTTNKYFYYEYTGYRYSFQPLSDYYIRGTDGSAIRTNATNTSLSLIWYNFVGNSGISGQLVLTGSDSGVDYITSNEIVSAFNSINNTAKFTMNFNGCDMNVYIRINPAYTSQGWSIEDCYNYGWWSIMVSSVTSDMSAYTTPSNPINLEKIWDTLINLFMFDMSDYPMSPIMQIFASLAVTIVLYSPLLAMASHNPKLLIIVAVIALIQTVTAFINGLNIDLSIDPPEWWPW